MKNTLLLGIGLLLITALNAQLENTRWKTILHIPNPTGAILDFKKGKATIYTVADSSIIETMSYTQKGNTVTLTKLSGQSDCSDGSPGQYSFTVNGDNMFCKLVKDDCQDRYTSIQNTKWMKWKVYPGIKVSEGMLKTYTGTYQRDAAHPIIISLDKGVLYAEGPNNQLPKSPMAAITSSTFFLRIAGVKMDFVKDAGGKVVKLISHEETDMELRKLRD
jgi:hypothetical protein